MRSLISSRVQKRLKAVPTIEGCTNFDTDISTLTEVLADTSYCFKTTKAFYMHSTGNLTLTGKKSDGTDLGEKENVFAATCKRSNLKSDETADTCYYKLTTKAKTNVKFFTFDLHKGMDTYTTFYTTYLVAREQYHLNVPMNYIYSDSSDYQKQIQELQIINVNKVNISLDNGNPPKENLIFKINDVETSKVEDVECARVVIDFKIAKKTLNEYPVKLDVSAHSTEIPIPNQAFRLEEYVILSSDVDNWLEYRGLSEHPDKPAGKQFNTPLIVGLTSFFVVTILVTAFVLHYCVCPKYNPGDQEDEGSSSSSSSSSSS